MQKLFLFSVSILLMLNNLSAVENSYIPTTGVRGAAMGSIVYPGIKIGLERPYKYTKMDKVNSKRTKTYFKERYMSYSLAMYHHERYHSNFLLQIEWVKRIQKRKGFYYEGSLGTGISRTFVDGPTYKVTKDGEIKKVPLSGNWYALISAGGSIGYNFNFKMQKPFSIFVKHNWLLLFPYNGFITPRPTIELGFNYNISGIWDAFPKFDHKEKQSKKYKKLNQNSK